MDMIGSVITFLSYTKQPQKRPLIKEALKLKGKVGLEVGGPSAFFSLRGGFPVYVFAQRIDGVNFSNETVWEGKIKKGNSYKYYKNKTGYQYIHEATSLEEIADNSYDFILSSHSLEHVANPMKALKEWHRVVKPNGQLILILPDKRYSFDHKRDYTLFDHLVDDYRNDTAEDDTTHHDEILQTHDEEKTNLTPEVFKSMLANNSTNRIAHHHVFNQELIKRMLDFTGFKVEKQFLATPFHLITIATRL